MCGFVGFTNTPVTADPAAVVKAMADRIVHRGPDDADYYVDGDVSLGFRRLSIIDLEGGRQPILNEDGTKAAAEAYMYAACKYRNGMVVVARCRDIDLWEKRDGKWLVVKRTVAGDNTMILHPDFAPDYNNGRDKVKDPSYDYFETIE